MFDEKVCEGWLLYYFMFRHSMLSKIFEIPGIDLQIKHNKLTRFSFFSELKYNYTLNHIFQIKCFHILYLFEGSFILAFDFACFFLHNNANHKVFGNRYYHRKLENE